MYISPDRRAVASEYQAGSDRRINGKNILCVSRTLANTAHISQMPIRERRPTAGRNVSTYCSCIRWVCLMHILVASPRQTTLGLSRPNMLVDGLHSRISGGSTARSIRRILAENLQRLVQALSTSSSHSRRSHRLRVGARIRFRRPS